jgi:death-on-curing protein
MAAAYLYHIAGNHGFVDSNKRTGTRAAYVFLALNGHEIDLPTDETEALVLGIAAGTVDKQKATEFIRRLIEEHYHQSNPDF